MAFGASALTGTVIATGTSGYILRFDLTSRRIKRIILVQAADTGKDPDDFSPVTGVKKTDAELLALLESPAAVECAYAPNYPTVDVYLDSAKFPRASILMKFKRGAYLPASGAESYDAPPGQRRLAHLYVQRTLRELQGKSVPDRLVAQINDERTRLGLA
jgi:hypothetical protein